MEVCLSYIRLSASCIASQLYDATHRGIALRAVFRADIILRKPQVFISLCRQAKYHCDTCITISLVIIAFEIEVF